MTAPRHNAVIDIGKTNAKLALVDLAARAEIAVSTRPNRVIPGPPWPHFDTEGHWQFILAGLRDLHARHGVDAISVTTHGASGVLLDAKGGLAAPVLDYEHTGPDGRTAAYDALRPDFALTGSPRLPMGLNLGAQLHYQKTAFPELFGKVATILTYPQYWADRLTGIAANERTSLGCHTDLWLPFEERYSDLVDTLEIRERMFVQAARVMGASSKRILFRHILPVVLPTLTTLATLDFAYVMLAESALSFLGIGIQPPEITWGLMISQGRQYLTNAWWLSFWPGLAIILTTMSLNLLSNWLRIALDPVQRWRLEMKGAKNG